MSEKSRALSEMTPEERVLLPGPLDGGDDDAAAYFGGLTAAIDAARTANPQVVAESLVERPADKPAKTRPAAPKLPAEGGK